MKRAALVTGGNRGIGRAIAEGLVAQGHEVWIGVRDLDAGQAVAREIGAQALALDLEDPNQIAAAADRLALTDILVNNAGILENVPLFTKTDNFARSMQIMVQAPYELIRAALPGMAARGWGRVVNISSGYGSFSSGLGGGGAYGIAKAALNALTVRAAQDAPDGVRINAACPGWVRTRMGGPNANSSVQQGADTALWLCGLPDDGPTGGLFRRREPAEW